MNSMLGRRLDALEKQGRFLDDLTHAERAAQARLDAGVPLDALTDAELRALLDNDTGRWLDTLSEAELHEVADGRKRWSA